MPYIPMENRTRIDNALQYLPTLKAGELAYLITVALLRNYADSNYAGYAEAIGVLETTKLEFVRRELDLYEDHKKETNGDVY